MIIMSKNQPDYGVDAPEIIRGFYVAGGIASLVSLVCLGLGSAMVAYGRRGKFNVRDKMLSRIDWQGSETVLDVGTGRGFLAVGTAKKLTTGKVVGIDIWRAEDLSGNSLENTLANVQLEGVDGKVEVKNEDARTMSFADGTFDAVISLLCIHNIEGKEEQERACREIARVLKPGGKAVIGDYIGTGSYVKYFEQAGLTVTSHTSYVREAYAAMRVVEAVKPAA